MVYSALFAALVAHSVDLNLNPKQQILPSNSATGRSLSRVNAYVESCIYFLDACLSFSIPCVCVLVLIVTPEP